MAYTYLEANKVLDTTVPLVTEAQLLLVCGDEIDDLLPAESASFINTAHIMLCVMLDGYSLPNLLLIEIEKYLSAHYATLAYPAIQREGLAGMSTSFATKIGYGLQNSRYGQTAISLDPTGRLQELSDGKKSLNAMITNIGAGRDYNSV